LEREPFQPFRFYVLELTSFEVRHPEFVLLGTRSLDLHRPATHLPSGTTPHAITIALLHITRLEPLFVPPSLPSPNGEQE
jgi:hypothetical protein